MGVGGGGGLCVAGQKGASCVALACRNVCLGRTASDPAWGLETVVGVTGAHLAPQPHVELRVRVRVEVQDKVGALVKVASVYLAPQPHVELRVRVRVEVQDKVGALVKVASVYLAAEPHVERLEPRARVRERGDTNIRDRITHPQVEAGQPRAVEYGQGRASGGQQADAAVGQHAAARDVDGGERGAVGGQGSECRVGNRAALAESDELQAGAGASHSSNPSIRDEGGTTGGWGEQGECRACRRWPIQVGRDRGSDASTPESETG
eukprot:scaffold2294_cov113-Isochrysis_galbana.AAC.1